MFKRLNIDFIQTNDEFYQVVIKDPVTQRQIYLYLESPLDEEELQFLSHIPQDTTVKIAVRRED